MRSSLMRGLAILDTCTQGPVSWPEPWLAPIILTAWREAEVHTPIDELRAPTTDGSEPSEVSILLGICRAMVCTFTPLAALTPGAGLASSGTLSPKVLCSCSKGRGSHRSDTA